MSFVENVENSAAKYLPLLVIVCISKPIVSKGCVVFKIDFQLTE